jgi:hypothetical protein
VNHLHIGDDVQIMCPKCPNAVLVYIVGGSDVSSEVSHHDHTLRLSYFVGVEGSSRRDRPSQRRPAERLGSFVYPRSSRLRVSHLWLRGRSPFATDHALNAW